MARHVAHDGAMGGWRMARSSSRTEDQEGGGKPSPEKERERASEREREREKGWVNSSFPLAFPRYPFTQAARSRDE